MIADKIDLISEWYTYFGTLTKWEKKVRLKPVRCSSGNRTTTHSLKAQLAECIASRTHIMECHSSKFPRRVPFTSNEESPGSIPSAPHPFPLCLPPSLLFLPLSQQHRSRHPSPSTTSEGCHPAVPSSLSSGCIAACRKFVFINFPDRKDRCCAQQFS